MAPVNGSSSSDNGRSNHPDLLLDDVTTSGKPTEMVNGKDSEKRLADYDAALVPTYRQLLLSVGENPDRDGLRKTPERAAKAIWYFTTGYRQTLKGANCYSSSSSCFLISPENE
jgi:hypothetical protein